MLVDGCQSSFVGRWVFIISAWWLFVDGWWLVVTCWLAAAGDCLLILSGWLLVGCWSFVFGVGW